MTVDEITRRWWEAEQIAIGESSSDIDTDMHEQLTEINTARAAHGLSPLLLPGAHVRHLCQRCNP